MTIFRRLSRHTVDSPATLEARPRPSAYLLGDFEHSDHLVLNSEFRGNDEQTEDSSSSEGTVFSDSSSDGSGKTLSLARAFSDFRLKMDDKNDSVLVSIDVPSDVPTEDLSVQVDDGILRVSGDLEETEQTVEQAFQLDEQSLDVHKMTASLANGTLTIAAPKKDSEGSVVLDSLPILDKQPPKVSASSYLVIIVDVPGVHKEDMHVSYTNGKLRIAGSRHFGRMRSFKRTLPVDTQKFEAEKLLTYLHEGRLAVIVPPKEEGVSRSIEIEAADVSSNTTPRAA